MASSLLSAQYWRLS
ncbi:hypothetical protein YPPY88_1430, partial [Yersinia pestis PY-88]